MVVIWECSQGSWELGGDKFFYKHNMTLGIEMTKAQALPVSELFGSPNLHRIYTAKESDHYLLLLALHVCL